MQQLLPNREVLLTIEKKRILFFYFFKLKNMPGYEKALKHRDAGLGRTMVIVSKKD